MVLDNRVMEELKSLYKTLQDEEKIVPWASLQKYHDKFKEKFGPEGLLRLEGEELLELMHNSSNANSLVFWLEYKKDDEFPHYFGGIGGGSALKFGIYLRKETGKWTGGSPQSQIELSTDQAIAYATKDRDELLKAIDLLESLPPNANDEQYFELQTKINRLDKNIRDTAWVHKYLHLLFPDKLDDYHNVGYQRFHLIKLLQMPPSGTGRYICAGRYIALANELGIPINNLTEITNRRHGRPYRYWRIGTSASNPRDRWQLMQDNKCIAIGWDKLADLSHLSSNRASKEELRNRMRKEYPNTPPAIGRLTQQVFNLVTIIAEKDIVLAADGSKMIGIGKVIGNYYFDTDSDFSHRRPVDWLSFEEWSPRKVEGLRTTVHQIRDEANMLQAEEVLFNGGMSNNPSKKYWVEKTIVKGRPDREKGDYRLGKVLWSPRRDKRGADIYRYMREVKAGDIVLHLTDNQGFTGISEVLSSYEEFDGVEDAEWGKDDSYLVSLRNYAQLNPSLDRQTFFSPPFKQRLTSLLSTINEPIFYNSQASLNQGHYFTPAPEELILILNDAYLEFAGKKLLDIPGGHDVPISLNPSYSIDELASETGFEVDWITRCVRALERKGQAIIYGPPGTGKTYLAERIAKHLISESDGLSQIVQFHPSYAYEDFMQGIRPSTNDDGSLNYPMIPGRLVEFCKEAEKRNGKCILIIDEINRANISKVFGEIMYLLEYRDRTIPLSSGGSFGIPSNVRIIGTMNTADRSIALVDYALRRRFAFIALHPMYEVLRNFHSDSDFPVDNLIQIIQQLNKKIADYHYEVGITFFLSRTINEDIKDIWKMEIEPYLEEYFFDQEQTVNEYRWEKIKTSLYK